MTREPALPRAGVDSRSSEDRRRDQITALMRPLYTIARGTSRVSTLTLEREGAWVFFERTSGRASILGRAPSSRHLPEQEQLDTAKAARLRSLGWSKSPHTRCFETSFACDEVGLRAAAGQALSILQDVYGRSTGPGLLVDVLHSDDEPPRNDDLVALMRVLAAGWNEQERQRFYQTLVNATLIIPLTQSDGAVEHAHGGADSNREQAPLVIAQGQAPEVELPHSTWRFSSADDASVLAFTDWDSFRRFDPRGQHYAAWRGAELIEEMASLPSSQLRINVAGEVGGALLVSELNMLRGAVAQWRDS